MRIMDIEKAKTAISDIKQQLDKNHLNVEEHEIDKLQILRSAINALYVLEQIKWENDILNEQLSEIGVGFAEDMSEIKKQIAHIERNKIK